MNNNKNEKKKKQNTGLQARLLIVCVCNLYLDYLHRGCHDNDKKYYGEKK